MVKACSAGLGTCHQPNAHGPRHVTLPAHYYRQWSVAPRELNARFSL